MAAKLNDYLARWRGMEWQWGIADCCTFPANRVFDLIGIDPMALWRGGYADELEAARLVEEGGGLREMFRMVRDDYGPLPEAAVLRFGNGKEVGGLAAEGWVHWFSPKGVHSWRASRVDVETFR